MDANSLTLSHLHLFWSISSIHTWNNTRITAARADSRKKYNNNYDDGYRHQHTTNREETKRKLIIRHFFLRFFWTAFNILNKEWNVLREKKNLPSHNCNFPQEPINLLKIINEIQRFHDSFCTRINLALKCVWRKTAGKNNWAWEKELPSALIGTWKWVTFFFSRLSLEKKLLHFKLKRLRHFLWKENVVHLV